MTEEEAKKSTESPAESDAKPAPDSDESALSEAPEAPPQADASEATAQEEPSAEDKEATAAESEAPDDADEADDQVQATESEATESEVTRRSDVTYELRQLLEFTSKYPEIGPTVAELCIKLGHDGFGQRILRMGRGDGSMEYFFVAGDVARREKRPDDVLQVVLDALDAFSQATDDDLEDDDRGRLLHLVRIGFAALMFDIEDVRGRPEWTRSLAEKLGGLRERFAEDAFFHTLWAQALWLENPEKSEEIWDVAVGLDDPESSWNARGTWYKEAEGDLARAENAYRKGLEVSSSSALLMHNLAQVMLDRAEEDGVEPLEAASLISEADSFLHKALKRVGRRGLRRHIHLTVDRLKKMRDALSKGAVPEVGDVVKGKVENLTHYGAFVLLAPGVTGLLHQSEIAHEYVEKPGDYVKVGEMVEVKVLKIEDRKDEDSLRISLSRKALLPDSGSEKKSKSKRKPRKKSKNNSGGQARSHQDGKKGSSDKFATLGDLLMAKMKKDDDA